MGLKTWVVRKVWPLVDEATRPVLQQAAREVLEQMAPSAIAQATREVLPAVIRDSATPVLQRAAEDTLTQASGRSMASLSAAIEASRQATEAAARQAVAAVEAAGQPLLQRLQATESGFLARVVQLQASLEALSEEARQAGTAAVQSVEASTQSVLQRLSEESRQAGAAAVQSVEASTQSVLQRLSEEAGRAGAAAVQSVEATAQPVLQRMQSTEAEFLARLGETNLRFDSYVQQALEAIRTSAAGAVQSVDASTGAALERMQTTQAEFLARIGETHLRFDTYVQQALEAIRTTAGVATQSAVQSALQSVEASTTTVLERMQTTEAAFLERLAETHVRFDGYVQQALEAIRGAADVAVQSSVHALEASAKPALERLQASHAQAFEQLAQAHAGQLQSLAEQASGSQQRMQRALAGQLAFSAGHQRLLDQLGREKELLHSGTKPAVDLSERVRSEVRKHAGLDPVATDTASEEDLLTELRFLWTNSALVGPMMELAAGKRVLYAGQAYYNTWYLSRALRERGWKADVLNWDSNEGSQIYYHGEDVRFFAGASNEREFQLRFYVQSLYAYDIFHFSNMNGLSFGWLLAQIVGEQLGDRAEVYLLKHLGKKIVYSNNGCSDGVSQTSFSKWGPESVCSICRWQHEPSVCSDERNLGWGRFRNSVSDYQCTLGGNRADFNDDPRVHEAPGFYCVDTELWRPDIEVPEKFRVPRASERTLVLYHAIGNRDLRTRSDGVNIKSSHVYLPLLDKLRGQGWDLELLEPHDVPNRDVRFLQVQADIFLEMLTYGWFGANAREAMMLGKPVICYLRPEWLESVREEHPGYVEYLPVVSATPDTIEEVLLDLLRNPEKRAEIGRRGREFMVRWHSPQAGAEQFDGIYSRLLAGEQLLRGQVSPASRRGIAIRRA